MVNFKLPAEQLQKILNYLATRPWSEVNNLIVEVSKMEKIEEKSGEAETKK